MIDFKNKKPEDYADIIPQNEIRANRAEHALKYMEGAADSDEYKPRLGDQIADILHLADRMGVDIDEILEYARDCYWEDRGEDSPAERNEERFPDENENENAPVSGDAD